MKNVPNPFVVTLPPGVAQAHPDGDRAPIEKVRIAAGRTGVPSKPDAPRLTP